MTKVVGVCLRQADYYVYLAAAPLTPDRALEYFKYDGLGDSSPHGMPSGLEGGCCCRLGLCSRRL